MADGSSSNGGPKLVTLTIDDREVTVPEGTRLIDAALGQGADVPHYCYHPGLSVAGNCRICIVEIVGGRGNPLQIACNTPVADGMVVKTASEAVLKRRADVLEFLLVNHPLDCPICDQAGECLLQIYYMEHDRQKSRVEVGKVHKAKVVPIGPRVMLDQERCILCTRCVRFLDEVPKTGELCVVNRGDHSQLTTFPGKQVTNDYSENIVDICPVGALTSRLFRFQARVWFLKGVDTVCPRCATGCNVRVDYYHHEVVDFHNGKAHRLVPRHNPDVNGYWMCDDGRLAHHDVNDDRAHTPLRRPSRNDEQATVSYREALESAVAWVQEAKSKGTLAGIASPECTLEELHLFRKLFREAGSDLWSFESWKPEGKSDDFLIHAEKQPNGRGARLLGPGKPLEEILDACAGGKVGTLVLLRSPLLDHAGDREGLVEKAMAGAGKVVSISHKLDRASVAADVLLPSVSFIERDGTFISASGRIQRIRRGPHPYGRARLDLEILGELLNGIGAETGEVSAAHVFAEIAREIPVLEAVTWEGIGKAGVSVDPSALDAELLEEGEVSR